MLKQELQRLIVFNISFTANFSSNFCAYAFVIAKHRRKKRRQIFDYPICILRIILYTTSLNRIVCVTLEIDHLVSLTIRLDELADINRIFAQPGLVIHKVYHPQGGSEEKIIDKCI
jgi:hypothetical protein